MTELKAMNLCSEVLNSVRKLKIKIAELEQHIQALRLSAENLVPILDGMPRATDVRSRVEMISVKILTAEQNLSDMCEELDNAKVKLMRRILDEGGVVGDFAVRPVDERYRARIAQRALEGVDILGVGHELFPVAGEQLVA